MAFTSTLCCLVCHGPVEVIDQLPPEIQQGVGWSVAVIRLLVKCPTCDTIRLYLERKDRFDHGDHVKRSLR